jgi:hypothetical protein
VRRWIAGQFAGLRLQPVENAGLAFLLVFWDLVFPRLATFLLLVRLQPSSAGGTGHGKWDWICGSGGGDIRVVRGGAGDGVVEFGFADEDDAGAFDAAADGAEDGLGVGLACRWRVTAAGGVGGTG